MERKVLISELKRYGITLEDAEEYSNKELIEMLEEKGWVKPQPPQE